MPGGEPQGLGEMLPGLRDTVEFSLSGSQVVVHIGISGPQCQRSGEMPAGRLEPSRLHQDEAEIGVRLRVLGIDQQRLLKMRGRLAGPFRMARSRACATGS